MKYAASLLLIGFLFACNSLPQRMPYRSIEAKTMGTTYHITYSDSLGVDYQKGVDSVLVVINKSMNTYDPNSLISQFNKFEFVDSSFSVDKHFEWVILHSHYLYDMTNGYFDPTVMPLVSYWGFGANKKPVNEVDSLLVDSLKSLVGFEKVIDHEIPPKFVNGKRIQQVIKKVKGAELDFSAIAKGYGVDMVGEYLHNKKVKNYMVEIGGEVICKGLNQEGSVWKLGIDKPNPLSNERQVQAILKLEDKAMATSGNYRNYYEVNGKKYVHTINPKTGYPENSTTLSVTVVAPYCMDADALATGFMAMGWKAATKIVEFMPEWDAYFIYSDENGEMKTAQTSGMKDLIIELGAAN